MVTITPSITKLFISIESAVCGETFYVKHTEFPNHIISSNDDISWFARSCDLTIIINDLKDNIPLVINEHRASIVLKYESAATTKKNLCKI